MSTKDLDIIELSPMLRRIVPTGARAEKLASGFLFCEGPIWDDAAETVIFTDFAPHQLFSWNERDRLGIYRQDSGRAVGLAIDAERRIVSAETSRRRIARYEADGSVTVLATHYDGKRLHSPNDVIVKSDGAVYFTDPYSVAMGDTQEMAWNGVYRIAPISGEVMLLTEMNRPNGLAFSPDESLLYIDDTNLQQVRAFDVRADGSIANGRVLVELDAGRGQGGADGMKVDREGNLYVTGPAGIWVIAPDGEPLGILALPEVAGNLCWGDADYRTLYVTASSSLYRVRLNVPGIPPFAALRG